MSEAFSLKWENFQSNVSRSFGLLKHEVYLHDVTLIGDDHHQVSAHKLILSACSEYFRNIFKYNNKPNVHLLLCLDGVSADDLNNVMEYIYNGEVKLYQTNFKRFLDVAQRFKLEGMTDMENEDEDLLEKLQLRWSWTKQRKLCLLGKLYHQIKCHIHQTAICQWKI